MGHGASLDYSTLTKRGTALGILLFLVGGAAEALFHGSVPAWEDALFFNMEVLGILLFLLSPLVFGLLLPLTE